MPLLTISFVVKSCAVTKACGALGLRGGHVIEDVAVGTHAHRRKAILLSERIHLLSLRPVDRRKSSNRPARVVKLVIHG